MRRQVQVMMISISLSGKEALLLEFKRALF